MKQKQIYLVIVLAVLLLCSVGLNVWQHIRMKPLVQSCKHDLVLMRTVPILQILSETNGPLLGEGALAALRSCAWAIFRFSSEEREMYRSLGLVKENEDERRIDELIRKTTEMHNNTSEGIRRPADGSPNPSR